jgi:hypothetical protein
LSFFQKENKHLCITHHCKNQHSIKDSSSEIPKMPRSYSRSESRSRSRSHSPNTSSYRRSRSPLRSTNDLEDDDANNCRLHVADLSSNCTKRQIEKAFEKWPVVEVWHAQASCFAFVVLRNREHVQQAINELDGR